MNITTIQKRKTTESPLWSGRFHFLVSPECDISYLRGAKGGYVNAIATAASENRFITKVMAALRQQMLAPDDEYADIENISSRFYGGNLSDEWVKLGKQALKTRGVVFTTFDLYDSI